MLQELGGGALGYWRRLERGGGTDAKISYLPGNTITLGVWCGPSPTMFEGQIIIRSGLAFFLTVTLDPFNSLWRSDGCEDVGVGRVVPPSGRGPRQGRDAGAPRGQHPLETIPESGKAADMTGD